MQTFKRLPNPVVLTAILVVALAATVLIGATHSDTFPGPSERIGTLDTGELAGGRPADPPSQSALAPVQLAVVTPMDAAARADSDHTASYPAAAR